MAGATFVSAIIYPIGPPSVACNSTVQGPSDHAAPAPRVAGFQADWRISKTAESGCDTARPGAIGHSRGNRFHRPAALLHGWRVHDHDR
jgi:hypothetical protein